MVDLDRLMGALCADSAGTKISVFGPLDAFLFLAARQSSTERRASEIGIAEEAFAGVRRRLGIRVRMPGAQGVTQRLCRRSWGTVASVRKATAVVVPLEIC